MLIRVPTSLTYRMVMSFGSAGAWRQPESKRAMTSIILPKNLKIAMSRHQHFPETDRASFYDLAVPRIPTIRIGYSAAIWVALAFKGAVTSTLLSGVAEPATDHVTAALQRHQECEDKPLQQRHGFTNRIPFFVRSQFRQSICTQEISVSRQVIY